MTKSEACQLMTMLVAAFPRGPWPDETRALYEAELVCLDAQFAAQAVRSAIRSCKYQPTLAELIDLYNEARKQARLAELERADDRQARLLASKDNEIVAQTRHRLRLLTAKVGKGGA